MRFRSFIIILLVLVSSKLFPQQAQVSSVSWLKIHDSAGGGDSLAFGNITGATYGIDFSLGELGSPPDSPGFYAKWISIPGELNSWGLGLLKRDFRSMPDLIPTHLHRDTFELYFKNDNVAATGADVIIRWPCLRYLNTTCDSLLLADPTGQLLPTPVNLFTADSLILHRSYDPAGVNTAAPVVKLLLFKYGVNAYMPIECLVAPTVRTEGPTNVTAIEATLHGYTTEGCEHLDHVTFQYGTTTSYGNELPAVAGDSHRYSVPLGGLKPNTTYHYRNASYFYTIDCSIPYAVMYGNDSTFTTSSPSSVFWITVDDGYAGRIDSMVFGNHIFASYGVDSSLGEVTSPENGPRPWAVWISIPGRDNSWGQGLLKKDLRDLTNPSKKDTFQLYFNDPDIMATKVSATLRWPKLSYLQTRTDSMFLEDPTQTLIPSRLNMFTTDSVVLSDPFDGAGPNPFAPIVKLRIYKYGTHSPTVDGVKSAPPALPSEFILSQNYPNPFNPTTTISFEIPKESHVTLTIYNLLGREVARLVNDRRPAGRYSVRADGAKLASGIYFYRLTGAGISITKKMLLMK